MEQANEGCDGKYVNKLLKWQMLIRGVQRVGGKDLTATWYGPFTRKNIASAAARALSFILHKATVCLSNIQTKSASNFETSLGDVEQLSSPSKCTLSDQLLRPLN